MYLCAKGKSTGTNWQVDLYHPHSDGWLTKKSPCLLTKEAFYPFPNFSRNHVELCCSIFFYLLSQHKALHCFCLLFLIHSPNGVHSEFRVEFLSSSSIQEDSIQSRSFSQEKLIDIHTVVVEAAYQFSIRSFSSKNLFCADFVTTASYYPSLYVPWTYFRRNSQRLSHILLCRAPPFIFSIYFHLSLFSL